MLYNVAMVKFFTDIIGSEILIKAERLRAGKVLSIVIDPDNGQLLGVTTSAIPGRQTAIPAIEIKGMGNGFLLVNNAESIGELEEIIRIKNAVERKIKIIGQKVFTESGQRLGKCSNATLNLKYQKLDKIFVTPRSVASIFATELIIPAKNIVEIKKDRIVVTDEYSKVRVPGLAASTNPAVE